MNKIISALVKIKLNRVWQTCMVQQFIEKFLIFQYWQNLAETLQFGLYIVGRIRVASSDFVWLSWLSTIHINSHYIIHIEK